MEPKRTKNDLHVWVINHLGATKGSLHAIGRIWLPPIQLRKAHSTSLIGISHRLRFVVCGVFLGSSHQHRSRTKNGIGSVSTHTLLSLLLLVRVALQAHSFMCSSRSSRFNLAHFFIILRSLTRGSLQSVVLNDWKTTSGWTLPDPRLLTWRTQAPLAWTLLKPWVPSRCVIIFWLAPASLVILPPP